MTYRIINPFCVSGVVLRSYGYDYMLPSNCAPFFFAWGNWDPWRCCHLLYCRSCIKSNLKALKKTASKVLMLQWSCDYHRCFHTRQLYPLLFITSIPGAKCQPPKIVFVGGWVGRGTTFLNRYLSETQLVTQYLLMLKWEKILTENFLNDLFMPLF